MLLQVIYSSKAATPMTVDELQQILVDARAGNEARDVTGALIFVDGVFLQVLEGERETVRKLMQNIAADARHTDLKVFHEAEVDHRMFATWRMAYLDARPDQISAWAGLPGTTTIDAVLGDLQRDTTRVARVATGILKALAP
jgi:hypothetical protein